MKKILSLALALVLIVSMVGCQSSGEKKGGDSKEALKNATLLVFNAGDPYTSSLAKKIQEEGLKHNIKVEIQDAQNDLGKQNDQVDVALKKSDILFIQPVNNDATLELANKVKKGKKPVIFFNREATKNSVEAMKVNNSIFVGTKIEQAGIMQGDIIADLAKEHKLDRNGDGKITYVMLQGEPSNPEAIARTKYSVETAKAKGVNLEIHSSGIIVANWSTENAKTAVDGILAKDLANVELIIANNDGMALGAVSSLQAVGYNKGDASKWIPVIGVDAVAPAVEAIKKGELTATVKQDAEGMAKAIVEVAVQNLQGKLGKEAVEATEYKLGDDGVSIRVPYLPFTSKDVK